MNEKNLIPANKRTPRERKELASKGAKACNEAKRRKKELRECLEILLEREIKTKGGESVSGAEAISTKLFEKALHGDIKAFEVIRDTAGQKPVDKVAVSSVNEDAITRLNAAINKRRKENG